MKKTLKVFKFGGASLRDATRIRHVAEILKTYKEEKLMVVVSAMGKVTDRMEEVVEAHAGQTGEARTLLEAIKQQHYQRCLELVGEQHEVYDLINDIFVEVEWVLEEEPHDNYDYMYDQVVSIGELVSSRILHAFLNKSGLPSQWLDARDVIQTDNIFREGWVQWEATQNRTDRVAKPMLEKEGFVVTQGFIGSTSENFTTTLGREGSDYTAAIFSFCLDAESMTIWKDVPGVLTADPRVFENVTKLDRLSYKEAIEMTYYGAKIIHPKTIKPIQNKNIPLFVKSFLEPAGEGTYISDEVEDTYPPMVALEQGQALVQISTRDFSFVAEHHISHIFKMIAEFRLQVNMMQNTAISFVLCMNDIDDKVDRFAEKLQDQFKVLIDRDLELITVRHYQQPILDLLREGKMVLLEERIRKTVQMVVKTVPVMRRK